MTVGSGKRDAGGGRTVGSGKRDAGGGKGGSSATTVASARLAGAIARFVRARRSAPSDGAGAASMTAAAFRASVAERLRALERDVAEVRSRVNGLLFVVAGAVLTQLVLRLL